MDKESYIFSKFKSDKNGDDGAVVGKLVYSTDIFAQDIHFKKDWLSLRQIAEKSMLVNISDAIIMNAKPKFALLGVILPKDISKDEIDELYVGFSKTAKKFGIEIIGGDTTSGDKIVICVMIISQISKNAKPVFRKGMKKGDFLAYTGNLGKVKKDLERLQNGRKISKNSKFIQPKLKAEFFYKISPFISSAMDISDGLSKDLSRLCSINQCGVKWLKKLSKNELCSGEEYEILFSFKPKFKKEIQKIAKQEKVKLNIFAKAVKGEYKSICEEHHFKI